MRHIEGIEWVFILRFSLVLNKIYVTNEYLRYLVWFPCLTAYKPLQAI